jgi:hypothetical protein
MSLPQEVLDEHAALFRLFQNNRWVQRGENGVLACTNDVPPAQPMQVPTITLTKALSPPLSMSKQYWSQDSPEDEPELVYLVVIQGQGGAAQSKLTIGWTLEIVATALMGAAANSLSVVFSGAILKSDVKKIGYARFDCKFVKVEKLTREMESSANAELGTDDFVIPVHC